MIPVYLLQGEPVFVPYAQLVVVKTLPQRLGIAYGQHVVLYLEPCHKHRFLVRLSGARTHPFAVKVAPGAVGGALKHNHSHRKQCHRCAYRAYNLPGSVVATLAPERNFRQVCHGNVVASGCIHSAGTRQQHCAVAPVNIIERTAATYTLQSPTLSLVPILVGVVLERHLVVTLHHRRRIAVLRTHQAVPVSLVHNLNPLHIGLYQRRAPPLASLQHYHP